MFVYLLAKGGVDPAHYILEKLNYSEEAQEVAKEHLSGNVFSSSLLMKQIERDNYKNLKDFT